MLIIENHAQLWHAHFSLRPGTIETIFGFMRTHIDNIRTASRGFSAGLVHPSLYDNDVLGGYFSLSHDPSRKPASEKSGTKVQNKDRDMGTALRSVYQKTVEESIPDEMLALLGKLD